MLLSRGGSWPPTLFRPGRGFAAILIACALSFIALASPQQSARATDITWQNTGTNFNSGSSWNNGTVPGSSDVADFDAPRITQPNLSASLTIQELYFSTAIASGY